MRTLLALALVGLLVAGCGQPATVPTETSTAPPPPVPALAASKPVQLTEMGQGYEPSIVVLPDGHLVVTAHKGSIVREGTRLASWIWHSGDNGTTWDDMPFPEGANQQLFAFEGDLAVDGASHVYYVDTAAADNYLSRWTEGEGGPQWDYTRPQGTLGVDDRPWLAAQGDGIVYYLGNNGGPLPAPNNALSPGDVSRIWVTASTDGGMTWGLPYGFANSIWCTVAASPADDRTVAVGCDVSSAGPVSAVAYVSRDRGATWTTHEGGPFQQGPGPQFPVSVAFGQDGSLHMAWLDDVYGDAKPGVIHIASTLDLANWTVQDAGVAVGSIGVPWISAGRAGTVAVTYYATNTTKPSASSLWFATLSLTADGGMHWQTAALDSEPSARSSGPPGDFFQNRIGADNRVHVAFAREGGTPSDPSAYASNILYVRQVAGPNLG